jgi:hypothetical protein
VAFLAPAGAAVLTYAGNEISPMGFGGPPGLTGPLGPPQLGWVVF